MRKSFVALLLLMGAAASMTGLALAATSEDAQGDLGIKLANTRSATERFTRAARQGTASIAAPGDTAWIGHVGPGATYDYGPFHIGIGPNAPGASNNGVWDWTVFSGHDSDSLQGWWPMRRLYASTGGLTQTDTDRTWWAVDHGNIGNYVLNSVNQNRTFGVLGYWHVDGGNNFPGPGSAITWAPLAGTGSAWCGLRAETDLSHMDPLTGNPFNSSILQHQGESGGGTGTSKRFPGYTSQMDQMLYRDVEITTGASLTLTFNYRTRMSTLAASGAQTRTGWFAYDPSTDGTVPNLGPDCTIEGAPNYIANTGTGTPTDSFMVYLGVPVDLDAVYLADGSLKTPVGLQPHGVYDLKRRWLSEVIALDKPIKKVLAVAGTSNTSFTLSGGDQDLSAFVSAQTGPNKYLRIVFRVKTNRGNDDLTGSVSAGEGAAIVDDVTIGGTGVSGGGVGPNDFDQVDDINNGAGTDNLALGAWRTTGKPPGIFFHTHPLTGGSIGGSVYGALTYQDICGPPTASVRFCNMAGVVISAGTHPTERSGGVNNVDPESEEERTDGMCSPTINLMSTGPGDYNGMGLDYTNATALDDYYVWYDIYTGVFNLFFTGNAWWFGFSSYPALMDMTPNGTGTTKVWGELRAPGFIIFNPDVQCLQDIEPAKGLGLVKTSNAGVRPDSMRVYMGKTQQCFRFSVDNTAQLGGAYFDNVSFAISRATAGGGGGGLAISVDIWRFINDAFPVNETPGLPGSGGFDTTSAVIKTGINTAQATGNANRFDIPGDSVLVIAYGDLDTRADMHFRILPGPGNYKIIGTNTSGLRPVPTDAVNTVSSGDGSFWGQYMATPGDLASANAVTDHSNGPSGWSKDVWNSARMDTADVNIWPVQSNPAVFNVVNFWFGTAQMMGCYEETDPHFSTLGKPRHWCFLNNPATTTSNSTNLTCTSLPAWVTTGAGYNTADYPGDATKEGTKIVPDGLLTPGSHVQYFFSVRDIPYVPGSFLMCPETLYVSPQFTEGSVDGHRWQEFSVLPDRWKGAFTPGTPLQCMLYVDLNDRRGNERIWVSVADSIGATSAAKRGAHNGWRGLSTNPYTDSNGNPIDISGDATVARYDHGGSAGSTWDMYGVKASESLTTSAGALGGRFAPTATGYATGKDAKVGPTPEMLNAYYKVLFILTGDLNSGILGQFINRGQNDITILTSWLAGTTNRAIYIAGDGFAQSEYQTGSNALFANHKTLLNSYLGLDIRKDGAVEAYSFQPFADDFRQYIDIVTSSAVADSNAGIYSVGNACLWGNDILQISGVGPQVSGTYGSTGGGAQIGPPPYISGIYYKPVGQFYEAYTDAWDIEHLFSRYGGSSIGRLGYYFNLFARISAFVGCQVKGTPLVTTGFGGGGEAFVDYMMVRDNLLKSGRAYVDFGLARGDRVQIRIYDVAGRVVRTLANKSFEAGKYSLPWDGTDDSGVQLARGVYFAQVRYLGTKFTDAKRLIVLK